MPSMDPLLASIPVMVGARYLFGQGKFHPYLGAELGMHFASFEL